MKKYLGILAAALLSLASLTANAGQNILLASAVRAVTTASADQVKTNYRGVYVFANVTAVPAVVTITWTIQGKDPEGNYYTILSSTASATTGIVVLKVYPGMAAANSAVSEALPDVWRVVATYSAGANFTWSLSANTLQ